LRAGIIVPSGNCVAEPEIRAMLPEGVAAFVTRLPLRGSSEAELMAMLGRLEGDAGLLKDAGVERIVFHCTAVSTFTPHLAGEIGARISAATGLVAFATADAVLAGCAAIGARRIVLFTPYIEPVHRREVAFLNNAGLEVVHGAFLDIATNDVMASREPATLLAWAQGAASAARDFDACFLSCTALRSAPAIAALEAAIGRPVLTSNQAMVWYLLRTAGITDAVPGFGRLFDCVLPADSFNDRISSRR
jgi:maleate cis-trans isomerase